MIRRVVDRLLPVVNQVVVNARRSQRSAFADVLTDTTHPIQFAIDRQSDSGPVAGLETALEAVETDTALVLGCDIPLIRTATLAWLLERLETTGGGSSTDGPAPDCVLPLVDGRPQPLCGAYSVERLEAAIDTLGTSRNRSFDDVLEHLHVVTIPPERLPGSTHTFANVNTRIDLQIARARAKPKHRNERQRTNHESERR